MSIYYQDERVTLYHGDCREVMSMIEPESVDCALTDPPYGVDRNGQMLGQISANYHEKGTHSRGYADHDRAAFQALLVPAFSRMFRALKPGAPLLTFGGSRTIHQITTIAEDVGFSPLDLIVFAGGGTYAKSKTTLVPAHEPAAFMRKPGPPREINPRRNVQNVVTSPKAARGSAHPTTKPASWMNFAVDLLSRKGDLILDPFAGSGSTLVAAAMLGRRAVGVEVDESYCEIAALRLAQGAFDFGGDA